jgi:hypothetical protein
MSAVLANYFRLGDRSDRCRSCGSSLPPYQTDPPPPMTSGLALFFLIIGGLMVATIITDPSWTTLEPASMFEAGDGHNLLAPLSVAGGLLAFGATLLTLTLRRAGRRAIRWICRRCGGLFRIDSEPGTS